jgi:hypothetical protein
MVTTSGTLHKLVKENTVISIQYFKILFNKYSVLVTSIPPAGIVQPLNLDPDL